MINLKKIVALEIIGFFCFVIGLPAYGTAGGNGGGGGKEEVRLTFDPSPVQAGRIAMTLPFVTVSGLRRAKSYYILLRGDGQANSANVHFGEHMESDKTGSFVWEVREDPMYGRPDAVLEPGEGEIVVWDTERDWVLVGSIPIEITPNPGEVEITSESKMPGNPRTFSGSGADPWANLTAKWYDVSGCECWWLAGCRECTYTERKLELQADGSGNFGGEFTPEVTDGGSYCEQWLSIEDEANNLIVATGKFSYCN